MPPFVQTIDLGDVHFVFHVGPNLLQAFLAPCKDIDITGGFGRGAGGRGFGFGFGTLGWP